MAVNRYRRQGRPGEGDWHAAQYRPGEPLDGLQAVLKQLPQQYAAAQVVHFPLAASALAVFVIAGLPAISDQWLIIEPWAWLAVNAATGFAAKITSREMSRDWELAEEPP